MKTITPEAPEGRVVFISQFLNFSIPQFWSAFLLFALQPLLGRYLLPRFGGGPGVWTACMLFFQAGLLLGYIYAHWIVSKWKPRTQAAIHLALLSISLLWLPIAFDRQDHGRDPTREIILLLATTVGLPYFLLASTGPLLQRWFYLLHRERSPYRFYALSNAGSLVALLSYPFVVEPLLPLGR